jgi:hypothetical protein
MKHSSTREVRSRKAKPAIVIMGAVEASNNYKSPPLSLP